MLPFFYIHFIQLTCSIIIFSAHVLPFPSMTKMRAKNGLSHTDYEHCMENLNCYKLHLQWITQTERETQEPWESERDVYSSRIKYLLKLFSDEQNFYCRCILREKKIHGNDGHPLNHAKIYENGVFRCRRWL